MAVTSVFFACTTGSLSGTQWNTAAASVLSVFDGTYVPAGGAAFLGYAGATIYVKAYDLADVKPRPVKASVTYTPTSANDPTSMGVNEACVPLRFYSGRNVKTQRGRIYVGGWSTSAMKRTVQSAQQQQVFNLGQNLAKIAGFATDFVGVGGIWCLWARKANLFWPVTNFWVNDQWAHMESREHIETNRMTGTYNPPITDSIHGPAIP
jgi:hypothetical protein